MATMAAFIDGAGPARRTTTAADPVLARELWELTAAATGVTPDPDVTTRS